MTDRRPFDLVINNGAAGVWLFFSLSGYLIAGPFVRALLTGDRLPALGDYATRRAARIYPAYILALSVVILFGLPRGVHMRWWQYPLHFSLFHNLWPGEEQAIMFASWTLTLEVLFYIAVPVVAMAVRRIHNGPVSARAIALAIGAIWVASVVWTRTADVVATSQPYGLWLRFLLPSVLSMFCPGVLVSLGVAMWRRDGEPPALLRHLMDHRLAVIAGIVALFVVGAFAGTTTNFALYDLGRQPLAIASGLVVVLAVTTREPPGTWGRLLGWFGSISYGIYLWQAVYLGVIDRHGARGWVPLPHTGATAYLVHVLFLLTLVLPTAWLSWVVIERPMIRWARRRARVARRVVHATA